MTKAQGLAYLKAWRSASRFLRNEVRNTPVQERLRNVQFMLDAGQSWPWTKAQLAHREKEVAVVRSYWLKLREALGG